VGFVNKNQALTQKKLRFFSFFAKVLSTKGVWSVDKLLICGNRQFSPLSSIFLKTFSMTDVLSNDLYI